MFDARETPAHGSVGEHSAQIHKNPDAERLRDELADFLFGMTEENFDGDRLEELLDALDEADPMPEISDEEETLAAFHERYAPLFAAVEASLPAEQTIESSSKKKHSRSVLYKLLPVAAALVILLGSVTAQAFGLGSLFEAFSRWTSELFQTGSDVVPHAAITAFPLEVGEKASYDSLEEALDAFGVTGQLVPTWIPERFELEEVTASNQPGGVKITANYVEGENSLIIRYREITPDSLNVEKGDTQVSVHPRGGIQHYVMPNYEQYQAHWQNGELNCNIIGNVSKEEMVQMIESIYEGE